MRLHFFRFRRRSRGGRVRTCIFFAVVGAPVVVAYALAFFSLSSAPLWWPSVRLHFFAVVGALVVAECALAFFLLS